MFNSQFSILIRKEKPPHVCEPACKTNDPCCDFNESFFELELSIGQIPGRIQGSGFCQVIFARALSGHLRPLLFQLTASCGNIIAAVLPNEGGDVVVDKDLLELFHRSV